LAGLLQGRYDATDSLVHVVDHGGIDFHAGGFPLLEFDLVPVANLGDDFPVLGKQFHRFQFLDASFTSRRVASVVLPFVLCDIFRERMHRPVCGGVGDVVEKGLVGSVLRVLANVSYRVVRDRVGVVPSSLRLVFWIVFGGDVGIVPGQRIRIEEGTRSVNRSKKAIKSTLPRPVRSVGIFQFIAPVGCDMPFPCHVGSIASWFESLGNGDALPVEFSLVRGKAVVPGHVTHSSLVRVESRKQRSTCRAAAAGVVELGEANAIFCERIEVRGFDLASVATDIGPSHVIGHDQDDIRFFCGDSESGEEKDERGNSEHHGRVA
jgi:hypothetical protein